MKRTLWTLLLALGMTLALCVGAGATTQTDFDEALSTGNPVQLENDFSYSGLLYVYSSLTIDLNGYALEIPDGIYVAQGARLTIKDNSGRTTPHSFKRTGGRWEWDKTGTETTNMMTVFGGVITGGTGKQDPDHPTPGGGGVYVAPGGTLTMEGGSIAGCSAGTGGGVYVEGAFTMSGSSAIIGCAAGTGGGGGVYVSGVFTMNGRSAITYCTTDTGITGGTGGGVWVEETGTLTMNDISAIRICTARTGGGVTVNSGSSYGQFFMNGGTITGCEATDDRSGGGGIFNSGKVTMTGGKITDCTNNFHSADPESGGVLNHGQFTMSDGTIGAGCTIFNIGSSRTVFTISGSAEIYADITNCSTLHADGGRVRGTVKNGYQNYNNPGTITDSGGTGSTTFHDKVENLNGIIEKGNFEGTVTNSSTIKNGAFRGEVINNESGTISGGEFTGFGYVTNNGTISGGTFSETKRVSNNTGGTITGGTFKGLVLNSGGTITGGDFDNLDGAYKVEFVSDGSAAAAAQYVSHGGELAKPADPFKEGFRFDGWYYDNNGSAAKWDFDTDKVTHTMTLTARWAPITYTVTYYAGQYANETNNQTDTKTHGKPLTLKGAVFTRTGYTQTGWTTGQTEYALGGVYENNANVVLQPVWTVRQYTITFDTDGGSAVASITQDCGTAVAAPAAPAKTGYTFAGWEPEVPASMPAENLTVKAKWARASSGGGSDSEPNYGVSAPGRTEHGSVAVSPSRAEQGLTVTVTVKPDGGYVLETLTVTDGKGAELALTDKGSGKFTFVMPAGAVQVKASFMEDNSLLNFFYDVPNDAYYYEAVKWAVENGITSGTRDGGFAPGGACTRAQIVTFLWRAAGCPEPKSGAGFADVSDSAYYAKAVAWAVENGVTSGRKSGGFDPGAPCTRAQAVTFLARALNADGGGSAAFFDVPADSYYAAAVAWAVANGVTNGRSDGSFAPNAACTRAQIVTFLYRAYGNAK